MRILTVSIISLTLWQAAAAQEKTPPQAESAPPEQAVTGTAEIGYRWVAGVRGDFNTYRSVVNLGSGPKLFGLDFTLRDPSHHLFDQAEVRGNSWGGEPYNTTQVDVRRKRVYRLQFDYRKIAYFNFLPSFANPGTQQRLALDERSFDMYRRTSDIRLSLFPNTRVSPYVGYTRNSGAGTGFTTFFGGGNEFPVSTRLHDHSDLYRAGVQMDFKLFHATVEEGGSSVRNEQQVFNSEANPGNVRPPVQSFLGDLIEEYRVKGDGTFTKGLFTSAPVSWLSIFGQFLYSEPHTNARFSQTDDTFLLVNGKPLNTLEQVLVFSNARLPHSSASVSFEFRPSKRLRITESWLTDRLHTASAALSTQQFVLPVPVSGAPTSLTDRLVWNYNQQDLNLQFDLTRNLTLRGGHRYVWGDAQVRAAQAQPGTSFEMGHLARHVGLAGVTFRSGQRLSANLDFEASSGQRTLFRTGLQDYRRASLRARYQLGPSLVLAANFFVLQNTNPAPGTNYDFLSRQNQISATWNPGGGSKLTVTAEYSRYTLRSSLNYIVPSTSFPELSLYRDNGHIGSSFVSLALPGLRKVQPRLSAGGSFFVSSGSRPTRYYQPIGKLSLPLTKHVEWASEWRWYALSQALYSFEGFRSNQFVNRVRLSF